MYYQAFYLFNIPACNLSSSCPNTLQSAFLVDVPGITGAVIWRTQDKPEPLRTTRVLFFICWGFQAISLIAIVLTLSRGRHSNVAAAVAFISSGSSVVLFMFLPSALAADYGSDCTSSVTPALTLPSPCTHLWHTQEQTANNQPVNEVWGPALGYYVAFGNLVIQATLYILCLFVNPCILPPAPIYVVTSEEEGNTDSDTRTPLTGYSSAFASDDSLSEFETDQLWGNSRPPRNYSMNS